MSESSLQNLTGKVIKVEIIGIKAIRRSFAGTIDVNTRSKLKLNSDKIDKRIQRPNCQFAASMPWPIFHSTEDAQLLEQSTMCLSSTSRTGASLAIRCR